jgi:hypothetical protein
MKPNAFVKNVGNYATDNLLIPCSPSADSTPDTPTEPIA